MAMNLDLWSDLHVALVRLVLLEDERGHYAAGDDAMNLLHRLDAEQGITPPTGK